MFSIELGSLLLAEGLAAHLALEGLLAGVYLEVLL